MPATLKQRRIARTEHYRLRVSATTGREMRDALVERNSPGRIYDA